MTYTEQDLKDALNNLKVLITRVEKALEKPHNESRVWYITEALYDAAGEVCEIAEVRSDEQEEDECDIEQEEEYEDDDEFDDEEEYDE